MRQGGMLHAVVDGREEVWYNRTHMRKFITIIVSIVLLLAAISMIPVLVLYLRPDGPVLTNAQAIDTLKGNDGNLFRFVVMSDTHNGLIFNDSATLREVARINRENRFKGKAPVDFVTVAGDITFRGAPWHYRVFNRIRSMIRVPVIVAVGNHDDDTKKAKEYFKTYAGEKNFSFTDRNAYFIAIDNAINDMNGPRFAWLEEELKKSRPYAHRFIIAHKPPLAPTQESWYRPETNKWAYRLMKLCEQYKVDMVFSGHEHMFREMTHGGVRYLTAGGGGFIPYVRGDQGGYTHYVVVRVFGDYVDYEVRKVLPPFWEYLTYYMWKDLWYFLKDTVL